MLRMLAAFPLIQPIAVPEAKVQTVVLDDVAEAVSAALASKIPNGFVGDLVENETHSLSETVPSMRQWLGFLPARREIIIPEYLTRATSRVADGVGRLGWRSPLRSTAVKVLANGVTGVPANLSKFGMPLVRSQAQKLTSMPARVKDRLFVRTVLLPPIIIGTRIALETR